MLPALPVDSALDTIRAALDRHRAAVLTAAPGAGKTTRVPPSLIDRGRVLLLQPRRVAARAMAKRIAEERSWTVGAEIGWHIRFDRQFSKDTRLLVVTEGILTAYLQDDPLLSDVATLIVDEFHERSVHADLGLALARQAWLARPDLRILVMSATLDTAPVSAFLGGCPVIDVAGTLHPMTVVYAPGESVADALRQVLPVTRGNVLCFLPGAREIGATIAAADSLARTSDVDIVALHGSLDAAEQDAALGSELPGGPPSPKREARRRVIVATNVAETSLTVPGVAVVIDTGLQKVARYDADRGVDSLNTERIPSTAPTSAPAVPRASGRAPSAGCGTRAIGCGRIERRRFTASICRGRCFRSSPGALRLRSGQARKRHPSTGSTDRRRIASTPPWLFCNGLVRLSTTGSRRSGGRCSACRCILDWPAS